MAAIGTNPFRNNRSREFRFHEWEDTDTEISTNSNAEREMHESTLRGIPQGYSLTSRPNIVPGGDSFRGTSREDYERVMERRQEETGDNHLTREVFQQSLQHAQYTQGLENAQRQTQETAYYQVGQQRVVSIKKPDTYGKKVMDVLLKTPMTDLDTSLVSLRFWNNQFVKKAEDKLSYDLYLNAFYETFSNYFIEKIKSAPKNNTQAHKALFGSIKKHIPGGINSSRELYNELQRRKKVFPKAVDEKKNEQSQLHSTHRNRSFYEMVKTIRKRSDVKAMGVFAYDPQALFIITNDLEVEDTEHRGSKYIIGSFIIRIPYYSQGSLSSGITIVNRSHAYHGHSSGPLYHYCIKGSGHVCWGSYYSDIDHAMNQGDLPSLVSTILTFLQTPAFNNPYCNWREWCNKANVKLVPDSVSYYRRIDDEKVRCIVDHYTKEHDEARRIHGPSGSSGLLQYIEQEGMTRIEEVTTAGEVMQVQIVGQIR